MHDFMVRKGGIHIKKVEENERVGEINYNKQGTQMKIIKYINSGNIDIEFQDEMKYKTNTTYNNFKKGNMSNPYDRKVFGYGYIGVGKHQPKENNKLNVAYQTWRNIIIRCYHEPYKDLNKAYYGICSICEEWFNYQNFADWYYDNIYPIENERIHIDKDVMVHGNKIYSPETCVFLPQRINMIFMDKPKTRDVDLPNTVYRCKNGFKTSYNGKSLGVFKTLEEAIQIHDDNMRVHIKQVAEEYRDRIPDRAYQALLRW